MKFAGDGHPLRSEHVAIKTEPGIRIKSEFERDLASLPMAPTKSFKNEPAEEKKSALAKIPDQRSRARRSRRRFSGAHFISHRVGVYRIRAHYGHGKVDFTVEKTASANYPLKWKEVEEEIFKKLHRARIYIEPLERPGHFINDLRICPPSSTMRFSIRARRIQPQLSEPPSHNKEEDEGKKAMVDFALGFSQAAKVNQNDDKGKDEKAALFNFGPGSFSTAKADRNGDTDAGTPGFNGSGSFSFGSDPPKPATPEFESGSSSFNFGSKPPKPGSAPFRFGSGSFSAIRVGRNGDTDKGMPGFTFGPSPSPADNAGHHEPQFPKASLPSDLPTITSYQLDMKHFAPSFIQVFR